MPDQILRIPARDEFPLEATLFEPEHPRTPTTAVAVSAATGVSRAFYHRYATFLAEGGLAVLTYDYRGIGGSRPARLKGFPATIQDWGRQDLAGVLDWLAQRYPGARLAAVGHSIGGLLVGLADNGGSLDRLLSVAAQSAYWRDWHSPQRYGMYLLWHGLMPAVTRLLGYFPARRLGLGEDLPYGVAMEWARRRRHEAFLVDEAGEADPAHFASFHGSLCAYSFDDDPIATPQAVERLLAYFSGASACHRHWRAREVHPDGVGHFGFFRPALRESLWHASLEWLRAG